MEEIGIMMLATGAASRFMTSGLALISSIISLGYISHAYQKLDQGQKREAEKSIANYMNVVTMGLMIASMAASIMGAAGIRIWRNRFRTEGNVCAKCSGGQGETGAEGVTHEPTGTGNNQSGKRTGGAESEVHSTPDNRDSGSLPGRNDVPVGQNHGGAEAPPLEPPPAYTPPTNDSSAPPASVPVPDDSEYRLSDLQQEGTEEKLPVLTETETETD